MFFETVGMILTGYALFEAFKDRSNKPALAAMVFFILSFFTSCVFL